jgi:predicted AlkP superfamily pyrophosphatase or phosphodiesterase
MRFKYVFLFAALMLCIRSNAQQKSKQNNKITADLSTIARPKLVVGIVIDQMRWDYLYRFYSRYGNTGFKRLMNEGFSAENTFIPYTPTYTACGHASIYTGSVPAINGIIGNNWYDPELGRDMYCVEDKTAKTVGSPTKAGEMSPKNLLVTTIGDELRLASNFKSKVIGIAQKDRGAILPAGHSANAAYWYDGSTKSWISSSYYMQALPTWVTSFNAKKNVDETDINWKTLYPIETYLQSSSDDNLYEGKFKGENSTSFPHIGNNTPYGNTMTLNFAKLAIQEEKLGQTGNTDLLTVSCSATDYVGHQFGPNSIEIEDTYLRLDKDLGDFFAYLDKTLGKGNYLIFLSADHAVAHVPGFMADHKLPAGKVSNSALRKGIDTLMMRKFNLSKAVISVMNNQVYFDHSVIDEQKVDFSKIKQATTEYLRHQDGIMDAVDLQNVNAATIPEEIRKRVTNGYNAKRSGDVYFIFKSNWFDGGATGASHSAWYAYDSHIPLLFMGWKVKSGSTNQTHYMTDIASTLAAMLHIQMPSGSIGAPITELTHR